MALRRLFICQTGGKNREEAQRKNTAQTEAHRCKHSEQQGLNTLSDMERMFTAGLDKWMLRAVKNSEMADVTLVLFSLASIGREGRL